MKFSSDPYQKEEIDVARSDDLSKDERIKKETRRLKRLYRNATKNEKTLIDGLIQRAAFMRTTLEDYEKDIDENGAWEMFTQSEKTEPYERERPVARLYNTMNKQYQTIIKQLGDLLKRDQERQEEKEKEDPLMTFVGDRS